MDDLEAHIARLEEQLEEAENIISDLKAELEFWENRGA